MKNSLALLALAAGLVLALGASAPPPPAHNLLTNTAFKSPNKDHVPERWHLVKSDKEDTDPGAVTLDIVRVSPPPESHIAQIPEPPKTIPALAYAIDEKLTWAYVGQRSAETEIPTGKTFRVSFWLKSDKKAKVCVILTFLGKAPEGEGKLPQQSKWTNYELSPKWKLCTSDLTVDDAGPYLFYWPRVQLYTPDAAITLTLPVLEEVKD